MARGRWVLKRKTQRIGKWSPPPASIFKIDIDEFSEVNPRHARVIRFGRISRNDVFFFSIYKVHQTNNLIEALSILIALEMACAFG